MKTIIRSSILLLAISFHYQVVIAQKASDILENGIQVKSDQKIFLQYDGKVLKFALAKSFQDVTNPPDFLTLIDSTIFLASKSGVNIYLKPLNPLNYSFKGENKIVIDPVNEAASKAMKSITDLLGKVITDMKDAPPAEKVVPNKNPILVVRDTCNDFEILKARAELIQSHLLINKKDSINEIFMKLKSIDFGDENATEKQILNLKKNISGIENHFKNLDEELLKFKGEIENYKCDIPEKFITKYIFNSILKEVSIVIGEQKKRLSNLQSAFNIVEKAQQSASLGGGENGLRWCQKVDEVPATEGKISKYSITINESGYNISKEGEIIVSESKDLLKRTINVRKFQRFVPEVSVGIAYTFFKYNTYGTTSDSTGQQFVAAPTENKVENINISTMINWNLFSPNSAIHPLIQTGIGINSGIPSFLLGGGLRFSNNAKNRLRIAGGLAMTWIKELDKLKVGDKVLGTSDIDNDLKYSASPKFSPYIGLQYNF
jgi:ribosomal protein S15P/S13E